MGASNYIFAQARASEQIADWIGAHVDLFAFLGGAPKFVVCDNLKAAVTNPDRYEPGLNRSYLELADHYGVGDSAGAALQAARQGQGRTIGADRRAVDFGPAAQSAVSSAPPISTRRSPNSSATSTPAS